MKQKILQKFNLSDDKIVSIYPFGSRVYGTFSESSDYDYWVICKSNAYNHLFAEKRENISIHLYDEITFIEFLNQSKMPALECIYLPKELLLKYTKAFKFKLDIDKLRLYVADKVGRDIQQAKLRYEANVLCMARKALFHGIRVADFSEQIIKHGKIVNYSSVSHIWKELSQDSTFEAFNSYLKKYEHFIKK